MKMGIFGFGNGQPQNVFTFGGKKDQMTPKQFGNFAVTWSVNLSAEAVDAICKSDHGSGDATGPSLIARIAKRKESAHLELLAIHAASYLCYAIAVLNVQKQVVEEMRPGIVDGIATIQREKGKSLPEQQQQYIHRLIGEYCKTVMSDFHTEKDPRAIDVNGSATFRLFLRHVIPAYSEDYDQPENFSDIETTFVLSHSVADSVVGLMMALKTQGLVFHP